MRDKLSHIIWVQGIQNIVEVDSVRYTSISSRIRHVSHEFLVIFELLKDAPDSKFIIQRHIDVLDLAEFKQVLVSSEDLLEEVFVDVDLRRYVELEVVLKELHEILLGAELTGQLRGHDPSFLGACAQAHICLWGLILLFVSHFFQICSLEYIIS